MVEDDKEKAELKQLMETILDEEEVANDVIPLAVKEDLEELYKLVKARYGSTRLVESMDYLLWSDMKIMFEPHAKDEVWKLQKGYKVLEWNLYDSCGPSGPTEFVGDKAVYKELGDRLVIAATTASSLEAKQDSDNITKTQSKATPNESSSQRTNSGGCPWCQETMRDTTAQTRRAKKLKKRNRSRTYGLKRLYKFGLSARVESSSYEESLGEVASKQEKRIDAIDADNDITLVNDADKEMFNVDDLGLEEMFVVGKNENVVEEIVDAAQVSTAATTVRLTTEQITLAQALKALKNSKPKVKGIIFQEPEPVKPKKKDQIRLHKEAAKKSQASYDEEERLAREKAEKEQEANITLIET
nr:hypothetical protein [Tanacetum cinerariifolium]